ncbi:MAG: hypothetical protein KA968_09660 [Chitinophagaceae bacterium]|nr:hypothetical protein [Chitinophagaceae bacterium]
MDDELMLDLDIQIDVKSLASLQRLITWFEGQEYLPYLLNIIYDERLFRADYEIDFERQPLADLKEVTWNYKENPKILQETGEMVEAIRTDAGENSVVFTSPDMMQRMFYAISGAENREARDYWSISEYDTENVLDYLVKEIEKIC